MQQNQLGLVWSGGGLVKVESAASGVVLALQTAPQPRLGAACLEVRSLS